MSNIVHITMGAYVALQKQIQDEVDRLCDETHETITIEADLPDNAVISLTIDIKSDSSKIKFKDDESYKNLLEQAKEDAQDFCEKYQQLTELNGIKREMLKVINGVYPEE